MTDVIASDNAAEDDRQNDSWTDETRPHGSPHPDVEGATWDAEARAWVETGEEVNEPTPLTNEEMEEIEQLFHAAVAREIQYPLLAANDPEVDVKLIAFAYHNEARLKMLELSTRGKMKERWDRRERGTDPATICPYDNTTRNEFTFMAWVQRARRMSREVQRQRNRIAERRRNELRNERRERERRPQRTAENFADLREDLSPEAMIESESPYLICIGHLVQKRRGRIWYDEFLCEFMTDWNCDASENTIAPRVVKEKDMLSIMRWLMSIDPALSKVGDKLVVKAVSHVAYLRTRHVVREYLESLAEWDGTHRLARLMHKGFATEFSEYTQRVGVNWLVAMIARVMNPGCKVDFMVVLYGAQGEQKSTALMALSNPWYDDITEKADAKDFLMKLRGKWLLEVAELQSIASSRVEMAHVKATLSRQVDRFRPPYSSTMGEFPRQCVLAGTTNVDDWFNDVTGGRRFVPVKCVASLDLQWIRDNREQLFAEAIKLWRNGWKWWELPQEAHRQALEEQSMVGPFDNLIADWLRKAAQRGELYAGGAERVVMPDLGGQTVRERWGTIVTTERVVVEWLGMTLGEVARNQVEVGRALRRNGWERKYGRLAGVPVRHWVRSRTAAPAAPEMGLEGGRSGHDAEPVQQRSVQQQTGWDEE